MTPIVGCPIITKDERQLCYSCYQDDEEAELLMWVPDDPLNFPVECEKCGRVLLHATQAGDTPPPSSSGRA